MDAAADFAVRKSTSRTGVAHMSQRTIEGVLRFVSVPIIKSPSELNAPGGASLASLPASACKPYRIKSNQNSQFLRAGESVGLAVPDRFKCAFVFKI